MASLFGPARVRRFLNKVFHYFAIRDYTRCTAFLVKLWSISKTYRHLQLLPMGWMDQANSEKAGLLRRATEGTAYGPNYVASEDTAESVSLPDVCFRLFRSARIRIGSSSVIPGDERVVIERVNHPEQDKFVYSGSQISMHGRRSAVVHLGPAEKIKKGIFLGGNGSFNYYHWLVEILPKAQFLSALPSSFDDYPLLVSEKVEQISTFRASLDCLSIDRKMTVLKEDRSYVVDRLVYIDSPSNLPINLRAGERFSCSYAHISGDSIKFIRDAALEKIKVPEPQEKTRSKRIFLCRKETRRAYNEDEIFQCLVRYGFEKVYMGDLEFDEQLAVVQQAEWIVGPTGASWTNLMFCRSGTKCLCWMAKEHGEFSAFSTIAHLVGADMQYVNYETGARSTDELYGKDYSVDVNKVEEWLHQQGCVM